MRTSWDGVADWYDRLLGDGAAGTYQKELILPNLMRLMNIRTGESVLDLACGQGFFAREFAAAGARVIAADASPALIRLAKEHAVGMDRAPVFHAARAESLPFLRTGSIEKIAIILALQNIQDIAAVCKECARVLNGGGRLYIVLNHPAFRIPHGSEWGWDEKKKIQYRRIDQYISESKTEIVMHPGAKKSETTISFHRPLQFYFKALSKSGFAVRALEEWNSHKKSEPGPRAEAEDRARKEIPLFLCLVAEKIKE